MKNIFKILIITMGILLIFNGIALSQDNDNNDSENDNDTNSNENNNNENDNDNDDSDFFFNENELFGGNNDNMIEEVDEDNLQDIITVDSASVPEKDPFIMGGNLESEVKLIFNRDNDTGEILENTDFSMPLSFGLNFDFLIEDLILGSLKFSLDYVPQYYSYYSDEWVVDDFSIDDLRLSLDVKSTYVRAHSEFKFGYDMQDNIVDFGIDELFLDLNVFNSVYFRFGKQDIKWGSGYRWSPTDFLNEEKKDPLDPDEEFNPNGITGIRMIIPIETFNIIAFIGNEDLENILDTSLTMRLEFAYDFFEIALMGHYQRNIRSLLGLDLSAGGEFLYGTWEFWDEFSFSMGSNRTFVVFDDSLTGDKFFTYKSDLDTPYFKNVFGLSYNTNMLPEIITTSLTFRFEYYFNGEGYSNNDILPYAVILQQTSDEQVYEAFEMGQHYLVFGLSLGNIFSLPDDYSDFGFSTNYILNASDGGSILTFNLSYSGIDDISISLYTDIYFANEGTEFFFNNGAVRQLFLQHLDSNMDPVSQEITGYNGIIQNLFTIGFKFIYRFS